MPIQQNYRRQSGGYGGMGTSGQGQMGTWYGNQKQRKRNLGNRADQAFDAYMGYLGGGGNGTGGIGFGRSGFGSPNDPRIAGHLANMASGTRNIANDMVQRMQQQAGGGRGMRVQSGTNPFGQMARSATEGLARDYADRYANAVGFTHQSDALNANMLGNLGSLVGNLYGTEVQSQGMGLQGLQGLNARESELYNRGQAEEAETRRRALEDEYRAEAKRRQAMVDAAQRQQQAQQDWTRSEWEWATRGGNRGQAFPFAPHIPLANYLKGPQGMR